MITPHILPITRHVLLLILFIGLVSKPMKGRRKKGIAIMIPLIELVRPDSHFQIIYKKETKECIVYCFLFELNKYLI